MTMSGGIAHEIAKLRSRIRVARLIFSLPLGKSANSKVDPDVFLTQIWPHEPGCLVDGVEKLFCYSQFAVFLATLANSFETSVWHGAVALFLLHAIELSNAAPTIGVVPSKTELLSGFQTNTEARVGVHAVDKSGGVGFEFFGLGHNPLANLSYAISNMLILAG